MMGNGTTSSWPGSFLDRHEKEFPEIYGFKEFILDQCRAARPPHITTLFGRKRRVPGILSSDKGMRMYSERQAFNALVQGGAADINKFCHGAAGPGHARVDATPPRCPRRAGVLGTGR